MVDTITISNVVEEILVTETEIMDRWKESSKLLGAEFKTGKQEI